MVRKQSPARDKSDFEPLGDTLRPVAATRKLPGNIHGLLAATAFEHGLTVVTRNTRHFEDLGVALFDPWES